MDKTGNGCNGFYLYVLYTNRYLFNLQDKDREAAGPRQPPLASTHRPQHRVCISSITEAASIDLYIRGLYIHTSSARDKPEQPGTASRLPGWAASNQTTSSQTALKPTASAFTGLSMMQYTAMTHPPTPLCVLTNYASYIYTVIFILSYS